jgi:DedD protein
MSSPDDTEITLGTGKLLVLFFGLVGICALFFALGYSLGRKSEPMYAATSAAVAPAANSSANKPGNTPASAQQMTFYKSVEQKDANAQLTPAPDGKADNATGSGANANSSQTTGNTGTANTPAANAPDPTTTLPTAGYIVQVAAVTKQEDADSLVDALKKKDYPAFVASQSGGDKFFRVQVGPYSDIKDAEAMRTRLIGDGYSPILKK